MKDTWMDTFTGMRIDVRHIAYKDICLEDIAHSLALQCRYNGHCPMFYSVAEHSIRAAEICRGAGYDKQTQKMALLHDAAEAYFGDIIKPVKNALGIDSNPGLTWTIMERLGGQDGNGDAVKVADIDLLLIEGRDLMRNDWTAEYGPIRMAVNYSIWSTMDWQSAERNFIAAALELQR